MRFGIIPQIDVLYFLDLDKSPSISMSIRSPSEPPKSSSYTKETPDGFSEASPRMSGIPPARPALSAAVGQDICPSSPPNDLCEFPLLLSAPKVNNLMILAQIPELSEVDFHSAFEIKRSHLVLCYAQPPPLASEVLESLQDEGIDRVVYTEPFFGNIKDVPQQAHEYGGVRHKLRSHDPIHLPIFDPTGIGSHVDDTTIVNSKVWTIALEPPTRSEVCKWAEEHGILGENKSNIIYRQPKTRVFSQVCLLTISN